MRLSTSAIVAALFAAAPVAAYAQTTPAPAPDSAPAGAPAQDNRPVVNSTADLSSLKAKLSAVGCTTLIDYRGPADALYKVGIITCKNPDQFKVGDNMMFDPPTPTRVGETYVYTVMKKHS